MGNWHRVQIIGTIAPNEVPAARDFVRTKPDYSNFHCLCCGGICGLPDTWPSERVDVVGNLAERDFSPESVAETLVDLSKYAPSASLKIHFGGDYEADECTATITLEGGAATVGPPEQATVPPLNRGVIESRFLRLALGLH